MALNAYSLSRCVNAERKTKKALIISRWGFFPSVFFFSGLSLPQSNQAGTWGVNKLHKLEICFVLSIFSSSGLTQLPSLPHHAEKEENTEWMWAVENTPAQEVAEQRAVAGGAGGGRRGRRTNEKITALLFITKVWLECPFSRLWFPCCDSVMKGIEHLS